MIPKSNVKIISIYNEPLESGIYLLHMTEVAWYL